MDLSMLEFFFCIYVPRVPIDSLNHGHFIGQFVLDFLTNFIITDVLLLLLLLRVEPPEFVIFEERGLELAHQILLLRVQLDQTGSGLRDLFPQMDQLRFVLGIVLKDRLSLVHNLKREGNKLKVLYL